MGTPLETLLNDEDTLTDFLDFRGEYHKKHGKEQNDWIKKNEQTLTSLLSRDHSRAFVPASFFDQACRGAIRRCNTEIKGANVSRYNTKKISGSNPTRDINSLASQI